MYHVKVTNSTTGSLFSFLIAPDGSIYEGRGWKYDAERHEKYNHVKNDCIDIAYIGNYIGKKTLKYEWCSKLTEFNYKRIMFSL